MKSGYSPYFLLESTVLVCSLRKNGSLGEFYSLSVVDWASYRFLTLKGVAYGENYELEFCGGTCLEVKHGKQRLALASDQTN